MVWRVWSFGVNKQTEEMKQQPVEHHSCRPERPRKRIQDVPRHFAGGLLLSPIEVVEIIRREVRIGVQPIGEQQQDTDAEKGNESHYGTGAFIARIRLL